MNAVTIEKVWNENEAVREGRNGRLHESRGRAEWLVIVNGNVAGAFDRRRDAREAAAAIEQRKAAGR